MYKLMLDGIVLNLETGESFVGNSGNRHDIEYQKWLNEGNTPQPADIPTAEELAKIEEINQAPLTARQYFAGKQAAIDFIRLTPAQQEAQIDAMTLAQLKTVVKYLTIAVAAIIKERFL